MAVEQGVMDAPLQHRLRIHFWGNFRLVDGAGMPVEVRNKKARACLALLASSADGTMPRERLAAMLWGDRGDPQARANLRQLLYELKPLSQVQASILRFDRRRVWLEAGYRIDRDLLLHSGPTQLAALLPARDELFLADLDGVSEEFDDWLRAERAAAEAGLRRVVHARVEEAWARGDVSSVRVLADAWTLRDPTDETITRYGMRADAATADGAGVAQRMRRLTSALATELGVKPAQASVALMHELLTKTAPAAAPANPTAAPAPAPANPTAASAAAAAAPTLPMPPARVARRGHWLLAAATMLACLAFGAAWWIAQHRTEPSTAIAEAARLTTNARQLSRGRMSAGYRQAAGLARRAIAEEPAYAPAWAELALASWFGSRNVGILDVDAEIKANTEIRDYLDRALELDPRLGRALAVRGLITGGSSGLRLLEQAVIEAPDDAEAWLWVGSARMDFGRMQQGLEAYRRAVELEPLWDRSVTAYVLSATLLGQNAAAENALNRFAAATPNRFAVESLRAGIARNRGDLVAAAHHGSLALALAPDDPFVEIFDLALVARAVGEIDAMRRLGANNLDLRLRFAAAADPQGAVARAQGSASAWWRSTWVEDEARLLLRAGRADLLLDLVSRKPPTLEVRTLVPVSTGDAAPLGPQLVLALRSTGRAGEAQSLVQSMHEQVDRFSGNYGSDFTIDMAKAVLSALERRDDEAVASLEQAFAHGWRGQASDWAVDPGEEPAFSHLRGRNDFERVRADLAGELGRMRPQVRDILAQTPAPRQKASPADDP